MIKPMKVTSGLIVRERFSLATSYLAAATLSLSLLLLYRPYMCVSKRLLLTYLEYFLKLVIGESFATRKELC